VGFVRVMAPRSVVTGMIVTRMPTHRDRRWIILPTAGHGRVRRRLYAIAEVAHVPEHLRSIQGISMLDAQSPGLDRYGDILHARDPADRRVDLGGAAGTIHSGDPKAADTRRHGVLLESRRAGGYFL
jgi:hypothetical protein